MISLIEHRVCREFFFNRSNICLTTVCCLLFSALISNVTSAEERPGAAVDTEQGHHGFIDWLRQSSQEKAIPGVALAIVSREGIQQLQTWGVSSVASNDPLGIDSIFRIASMSKTFAGTAAALLVDQNQQRWEAPISELFPNLHLGTAKSSNSITFKHIVSQSTGLMPHSYSNMLDAGVAYDDIKKKFSEIPTVCAPGVCYGYQNVVFSLIGDVIEQSTGNSFDQYVVDQLFKPLQMATATMGLDAFMASDNATSPHSLRRNSWRTTTMNPAYYTVAPASGVNASIMDMTQWVRAHLGAYPEVLSEDVLGQLHDPVIATPRGNYFNRWRGLENAYYALGWRVLDYKGLRAVHHGGGVRGYRSEMVFVPEANIGMVLLFNADSNLANDVVPAFLDSVINAN